MVRRSVSSLFWDRPQGVSCMLHTPSSIPSGANLEYPVAPNRLQIADALLRETGDDITSQ